MHQRTHVPHGLRGDHPRLPLPAAAAARALILAALLLASCSGGATPPPDERALAWLAEKQAPDGSWRSDTYKILESGLTMTPFVLYAISFAPAEIRKTHQDMIDRALALADRGVDVYPTYSRALWILVLTAYRPPGYEERVRRFARELRETQLTEPLGWTPADPEFGAWDQGGRPPRKPDCQLPDVSVTAFAAEALRAAGADDSDPALAAAKRFASRCQNLPGDGGGFFTTSPLWPVQNKAGTHEAGGFRSYGSATADVLRILRACGTPAGDASRARAEAWLGANFAADKVPGLPAASEWSDQGLLYYWLFAAARVSESSWRPKIREHLARLPRPDGSWKNAHVLMKEDDPLISTGLALAAWWLSGAK